MTGPTIHGVYDYWLGGSQHLRADRELAQAIAGRYPSVPLHIRAAHEFHLRAARWCAEEEGISRFVRAGHLTTLPGGRNVHSAVRRVSPAARVIYAYRDDGAHAFSAGLLAAEPGVTAVRSGEGGILALGPVMEMLAEGEPVCVIAAMLLHFADAGRAASKVARVGEALPPGSVFVVSMTVPGTRPEADEILRMFTPARTYRHTAADLGRWLDDAGLKIVEPGVIDVRVVPGPGRGRWEPPASGAGYIAGALARKP